MSNPFAGKAVNKSGEAIEVPEPGTHPAALVALVDLGTHQDDYQGETREARKCLLVWELVTEKQSGGEWNHLVSREYTLSFHKKATLRQLAESVRGKAYEEEEPIDYTKLLGVPCLVQVEVARSSQGNEYAKVKGVSKPMRGQTAPKPLRGPFQWFVGEDPATIPDWIPFVYGESPAKVVARCQELRGRNTPSPSPSRNGQVNQVRCESVAGQDEIPF